MSAFKSKAKAVLTPHATAVMYFFWFLLGAFTLSASQIFTAMILNPTESSFDFFLYKTSRVGDRGSFVSFCAPFAAPQAAPGSCPDGAKPLIKRVVAVAGDLVRVTPEAIYINNIALPNSKHVATDPAGQFMPHPVIPACTEKNCKLKDNELLLKTGEIWVAGDTNFNLDSRYFGPVSVASLR